MPFKIYTYEDPYKLGQTDFWEEIAALPHFCVARTMVNGLKDVMRDQIQGLICPLDNLVSFPPEGWESEHTVYKGWSENIGLRIQQYSQLTAIFTRELEAGHIDEKFFHALECNQTHFLDAIRLCVELDLPLEALDSANGNKEQRLFVQVLKEARGSRLFRFPKTPQPAELEAIINELAENELREYEAKAGPEQKDRGWYERAVRNTRARPLTAVVVHGVHQFSPQQLRLLLDMEKMGLTVIFLFNYQKRFSQMYASWEDIYRCFGVPIHHDGNIPRYEMQSMPNASNALGCAIGELYQGNGQVSGQQFQAWHRLYREVKLMEFANVTEYAHFISNDFEGARRKYWERQDILDRINNTRDHAAVLRYLDEQVYTANRDVHTLLKIYFPEYTKDRHFLAYPIGQFFSAIYRLWDYERGEIKIDIPAIKECLSSHILTAGPGEVLLRTFAHLQILFDGLATFEEFQQKVAGEYVRCYDQVARARESDSIFPLGRLAIYNKYKVTKQDIAALIKAIQEINAIAQYLFSVGNAGENYISFGKHFQNLEVFLRQRDLALANEEERELLDALMLHFAKVKPDKSLAGTFRDLQEGLHYYLKQKSDDVGTDWIVKNFEQIDGDILQSKGQFERGRKKNYHFACLSDRDLHCSVDDLLPWPLTDAFIRKVYAQVGFQFQVYYTALGRREDFLRYALFYGLCYNYGGVRLSYVKQYGDEITQPYTILSILGVDAEKGTIKGKVNNPLFTVGMPKTEVEQIPYRRMEMISMFFCPYRYFLDYVMQQAPVFQGTFLYQRFYQNCLIDGAYRSLGGQPKETAVQALSSVIYRESSRLQPFFFFWKPTEILDLEQSAKNYLLHQVIEGSKGPRVQPYQRDHMALRTALGKAKFYIEVGENEPRHPFESFEKLAQYQRAPKNGALQKVYSAYRIPPEEQKKGEVSTEELCEAVREYINQDAGKGNAAVPSDWCLYCANRGLCMAPFRMVD